MVYPTKAWPEPTAPAYPRVIVQGEARLTRGGSYSKPMWRVVQLGHGDDSARVLEYAVELDAMGEPSWEPVQNSIENYDVELPRAVYVDVLAALVYFAGKVVKP